MSKFYVYLLVDPQTHRPFYVGKGSGDRWRHHLRPKGDAQNARKSSIIADIRFRGDEPSVYVVRVSGDEAQAIEIERRIIRIFGRLSIDEGGILTNVCADSSPPSQAGVKRAPRRLTEETKRKISRSNTGKVMSATSREKMSAAKKGKESSFKGRKHSMESKIKIGNKSAGRSYKNFITKENDLVRSEKLRLLREKLYIVSNGIETYFTNSLKRFCDEYGLVYKSLHLTSRKADRRHKSVWFCQPASQEIIDPNFVTKFY